MCQGQTFFPLTNRDRKKWQFDFDAANRLTNTTTPLGRQTRQVWNNRGLVSAVRAPSGDWATNFYARHVRLPRNQLIGSQAK